MSNNELKSAFLKRVDAWPTSQVWCRGQWLTVQALTRDEAMTASSFEVMGEREAYMISRAVTEPFTLTEAEAQMLREASEPMDLEALTDAIADISGMSKTAREAKNEAFKSLREQSRAGVRTFPRDEAHEDSAGASEHADSV